MKHYLADHLDKHLEKCATNFYNFYYFKPFPDEFYSLVVSNLPQDSAYQELPHEDAMRSDGTSTRTVFHLRGTSLPFWRDLNFALCSVEVEDVFRKHLGFDGAVRAVARLFRDFSGYRIKPHPDSSKKACTVQFYLPSDESQLDLGTSLYSFDPDSVSFTEVCKLPFRPNSGYVFKVTEDSWHGTDINKIKKPRDSLIITYYKEVE